MIKAVIFDMDGLLIDSEPLWQEAEISVFSQVRVPLTQEMTKETMGLRVDEVVEHWHTRYPWEKPSKEETAQKIADRVVELVKEKGVAKKGVNQTIQIFVGQNIPIAIASSSWRKIIDAVVERLGIAEYISLTHSAQDELHGKPHPGVYLTTAQKLGVLPSECLAFEDSPNGVLAAKAAQMKCIAVPDATVAEDPRFLAADIVLHSLEEFSRETLNQFQN